ncbi:hypothetical protein EI42_05997 [Thermosporothrix hazakensis]|jgi:hypothetical protein|uniref:Uncharacterized protein n=1 Tax=Thermosporothrix hazakensis TaxID=644383 RepID=A0A326U6C9_THEHA|nr:hypothetical protein [Thermosporothrix hazakensis]PZW19688.1 hypothetical protein EI42_05997 [Thermosporothrix hazakensis]GCE49200.1 hypothetical protein KTH_40690 [Thermosporothrix hazakensis]
MAIAAYNSQFLVASKPSVPFVNEMLTDVGDHKTYVIANSTKRYLDRDVPVIVETSSDGTTWTPVSTGFTLYRVAARVVFDSPQDPTLQVRLASGAFYPFSQIGNAKSVEFTSKTNLEDSTTFNPTGAKFYTPTLLEGELKVDRFWLNHDRVKNLQERDLLIVSYVSPTGRRYEGYAYVSECNIKTEVSALIEEGLTFQLTDEFFKA